MYAELCVMYDLSKEKKTAELALAACAVVSRCTMGMVGDVRRDMLFIIASPRGHTRTNATSNVHVLSCKRGKTVPRTQEENKQKDWLAKVALMLE